MIVPTSPSERLLFTTVRIETTSASGRVGAGTGFFFNMKYDDSSHVPLIVTNKHVVKDAVKASFQLHVTKGEGPNATPSGEFVTVSLDNFEQLWIGHPDASVDLCVMGMQPLIAQAQATGKTVFNVAFDETLILTDKNLEDLSAAEEVLMAGYPIGLWDSRNNLPLIRKGITASHPGVDCCGLPQFVIDAACFPGSSGSPVLLLNEGLFSDKRGNTRMGTGRVVLLGVLFAGPQLTLEGTINVKPIPTVQVPISETKVMIHLGYVVKSREILRVAEHFIAWAKSIGRL
jgi:hypothetical protein